MAGHVVFVCVANRVRSPFAEFLFTDAIAKSGENITVSSAGYVPQVLKDKLTGYNISIPEPFFNRPMSELTRAALLEKDVTVPNGWRSKELSPEILREADLIFTAISMQKEALSSRYTEFRNKIFNISDLSEKNDYPFLEDFSIIPLDENFWHYCEEDPEYVSKTLKTWEEILISAFPKIIKELSLGSEEKDKALT
jgi:protein-tyrosine-phosphatase